MKDIIKRLLYGRYGFDNLTSSILCFGILFFLLYQFIHWPIFYLVSLVASIYALYRILSKDLIARRKENDAWMHFIEKKGFNPRILAKRLRDLPRYKYFKCMNCKQTMRIPRGKGKVEIKCPKCGYSFHSRT